MEETEEDLLENSQQEPETRGTVLVYSWGRNEDG